MKTGRKVGPLQEKSYSFAIEIVVLCQMVVKEHKEFVITRQLLKSGTAIGALVREAEYAASKPDFINKLTVALKEANETEYWLNLLKDTGYLDESKFESLSMECNQLISIMVSSLKTLKSKITS